MKSLFTILAVYDRAYVLSLKVTRFQYYTASVHMTYASTDVGSFHCLNQTFAES